MEPRRPPFQQRKYHWIGQHGLVVDRLVRDRSWCGGVRIHVRL